MTASAASDRMAETGVVARRFHSSAHKSGTTGSRPAQSDGCDEPVDRLNF